jgi:hypothetical protein
LSVAAGLSIEQFACTREVAEHHDLDRRGTRIEGNRGHSLMRAGAVEERRVLATDSRQMMVVDDEEVVEQLAPHRARESPGDRVQSGSMSGSLGEPPRVA